MGKRNCRCNNCEGGGEDWGDERISRRLSSLEGDFLRGEYGMDDFRTYWLRVFSPHQDPYVYDGFYKRIDNGAWLYADEGDADLYVWERLGE